MTVWVVGDVETTGVSPTDKIVELAFIALDDQHNEVTRGASLIDPEIAIPAGASAVNGITNKMVEDEPTIEQYMRINNNPLMLGDDVILVAHNAAFDLRYLGPHMPDGTDILCTLRVARLLYPDADNHKLQTLRYYLGLPAPEGDAHRAMFDVEQLLHLVSHMMQTANTDLRGLLALSKQPRKIEKWGFGKFKSKAIDLKDREQRSYVSWLLKQENVDPDLRATLEAGLAGA